MSVLITFEPSGLTGVVAEGTYLIDAAKRMGLDLGTGCVGGIECPECLVTIEAGNLLLTSPTEIERNGLGAERLAQTYRLACQVRLERTGEIVVNVSSAKEKATSSDNEQSDLLKKFGELSLAKKLATLVQMEAATMSEAFDAMLEKPMSLGTKVLDSLAERAKSDRVRGKQAKRPSEHQQ